MAGQIPDDSFAGSLSDPGIDPFEIPEVPELIRTPGGQAYTSAKPVPGPISPNNKLQPDNLYSRMRSGILSALSGSPAGQAYQYVRGGGLENALGLNQPALTQEQPNPAYQPWLDKGLTSVAGALNPENPRYGMTGQLVGTIGGALPGTMASEVPLKSIPIWGGAMMAKHGPMDFEPWREAMLKDFGPGIEPKLGDIYQKSKDIYEANIAKAPLNELSEKHLPNLQNIVDQYNKGVEGADWYLHTRPELERQFGNDTDLFVNLLAATSPNNTVPANLTQALKAYKAYKSGVPFELIHPGWMKSQISNMYRAVNGQPLQGQKIINFAKNLRGETEPVTIDRWMMRALGMPDAPIGTNTYKFADYWLSQIAHDMGVEPRQLQAAVWKTAREVGGESAATGQPFESMLAKRLAGDPGLKSLLGRVKSGAAPNTLEQAPSREQILTSLMPKWKKTEPTALTGTMEVASRQTPSGETAANLYDRLGGMDQSQPWVQELKRGYEGAQQSAFDALALPQGKSPSLISQLRSAITGDPKSIDPTIRTRGTYGTYENEINPNIQFSMEGMSEPQRHAMLSILGQHFKQAHQAASHFEAIPKSDPLYEKPDTYSVFLHAHPDPKEISQFSNRVGFPVNVRQYSNGTMLDLNTGGMSTKPNLDQVKNATHEVWGNNDHGVGYLPRRYNNDYLAQEEYQDKINALERIHDDAGRPGPTGNTSQSLSNIRAQIQAVAEAKDKAFQDWAQATQARLKALGYAQGGTVIDGGWYGQNSPSPVRMQSGGWWQDIRNAWNDPNVQPNPAYGTPGERTTNAQKLLGPWLGGKVNSVAQGAIDPLISTLQLANRVIPGANRDAVDERLRNYREQYKRSLPGGKEDWTNQALRFLSSGVTAGEMLPEIKIATGAGRNLPGILGKAVPSVLSKVASGTPMGAMYGALVPKETPNTLQETRKQVLGGIAGGIGEEFLAPPIERGIAALITKFGASPQTAAKLAGQATWRASDALPDPSIPDMRVPSRIEHEAQAEAATVAAQEGSPVAHAIARRITHAAGDITDPANFTNRATTQQQPSPPAPLTPDEQNYDVLSDPLLSSGEPYAGGGLYGQMRRASLRALKAAR